VFIHINQRLLHLPDFLRRNQGDIGVPHIAGFRVEQDDAVDVAQEYAFGPVQIIPADIVAERAVSLEHLADNRFGPDILLVDPGVMVAEVVEVRLDKLLVGLGVFEFFKLFDTRLEVFEGFIMAVFLKVSAIINRCRLYDVDGNLPFKRGCRVCAHVRTRLRLYLTGKESQNGCSILRYVFYRSGRKR
jgi:hypothetical protein